MHTPLCEVSRQEQMLLVLKIDWVFLSSNDEKVPLVDESF